MRAHTGQQVGNVVLREKIGEGGMGTVWSAEHVTLGREVAVKFLSLDCDEAHPLAQRFALEARTVARISSPHVPQIFDHGTAPDGTPYIVMELINGTNLRNWVVERGPLTLKQVARVVQHVALALSAAHELGIIHRDIKPENLILTGEGDDFHVRLIDFGIAKVVGLSTSGAHLTATGTTLGTASYMSPEQLMSAAEVDERSDLWSLAVVAYWALTRRLPFDGDTFAAVCVAVTLTHFAPVTEVRPGLPPAIDAWFRRALAPELSDRFDSALSMARALDVVANLPDPVASIPGRVQPLPPSLVATLGEESVGGVADTRAGSRVVPPVRRRRRLDALAGVAMGFFAVGCVIAYASALPSPAVVHAAPATSPVAAQADDRESRYVEAAPLVLAVPSTALVAPVALTPRPTVAPSTAAVTVTPARLPVEEPGDVHFTNPTVEPVRAVPQTAPATVPHAASMRPTEPAAPGVAAADAGHASAARSLVTSARGGSDAAPPMLTAVR